MINPGMLAAGSFTFTDTKKGPDTFYSSGIAISTLNLQTVGQTPEAVFSNPANPFFDGPTTGTSPVVSAWNALLDTIQQHYTNGYPANGDPSLWAGLIDAETTADGNYKYAVSSTTNTQSYANQYAAAYQAAQDAYDLALDAAAELDITQSSDEYWDAVALAEETLDEAIRMAATQFVQTQELPAYQTYLSNSGATGFQSGVAGSLSTFVNAAQNTTGAYVSGLPTISSNTNSNPLVNIVLNIALTDVEASVRDLPAETRASFVRIYRAQFGSTSGLPVTTLLQGTGNRLEQSTGVAATIQSRFNDWMGDISASIAARIPNDVWSGVQNVWDNTSTFLTDLDHQIRNNPAQLASSMVNGINNSGIVAFNTFTFGLIPTLDQTAQSIVQQNGFYRAVQVGSVFAREMGLTYLTMGAGRLATTMGSQVLGRLASGIGISTAAQTALLCRIGMVSRLMAPVNAYFQLARLTDTASRIGNAIQTGDFEGAARDLGRIVPTLPGTLETLRESGRLASAFGSFVVNGDPAALNGYLQACFAAGTPMIWELGEKPVEQFRVGDRVWCRSEADPKSPLELREIEEVHVNSSPIWNLHVGGKVIRTTGEHPFWVYGVGWTRVQDLRVGDLLVTKDGYVLPVEDILETGEWETVYNFRVTEHHTYYVGSAEWGFAVWAHNSDVCMEVWHRRDMTAPNNDIAVYNKNGERIPVWGEPQHTFSGGVETDHADRILAAINEIAVEAPADSYFVLNRAWRTGTWKWFESRNQPDILFVETLADGRQRVSAWEMRSPSDPKNLVDRLWEGWATFVGDPEKVVQGDLRVWGE